MTYEEAIRLQQLEKKIDAMEANFQTAKANVAEVEEIESRIIDVQRKSGRRMTDLVQYEKAGVR